MFDAEKFIRMVRAVEPGNYQMRLSEILALHDHNSEWFDAITDAFRFGFLKGQRAEKARRKKTTA